MGPGSPSATTRASVPPSTEPRDGALQGRELLVLQLVARGYDLEQIGRLRGVSMAEVMWDVEQGVTKLGAVTLDGAVEAARRRRLVL